jgi:hypothetical protein
MRGHHKHSAPVILMPVRQKPVVLVTLMRGRRKFVVLAILMLAHLSQYGR